MLETQTALGFVCRIEGHDAPRANHQHLEKMKIQNAINKLTKAGFKISTDDHSFVAKKEGHKRVVTFMRNGNSEDAVCIGYRYEDDKSDSMTDYCATFFCDTLTKAIRCATA